MQSEILQVRDELRRWRNRYPADFAIRSHCRAIDMNLGLLADDPDDKVLLWQTARNVAELASLVD
jgi:hypothetical protein